MFSSHLLGNVIIWAARHDLQSWVYARSLENVVVQVLLQQELLSFIFWEIPALATNGSANQDFALLLGLWEQWMQVWFKLGMKYHADLGLICKWCT